MGNSSTGPAARALNYRIVWRWHFYAGLFSIPFILWLSITGTIFLFHPQIQRWLDEPYDHLTINRPASANAQAQAALAAVPGSTLDSYQLPGSASSAAQVLVDKGAEQFRVYVHPETLAVLRIDNEDYRVDTFTSRLHGELLMGKYGSWIIELAGSWAVVMIVTGLYLWWPAGGSGLAGTLYPRLGLKGRAFWKDLHAVTGVYISVFALFLLFTGLPWAKSWGGYLKTIRHMSAGRAVAQDWTTSSAETLAARQARGGAGAQAAPSGFHTMADGTVMRNAPDGGGHAAIFGRHMTMLSGPDAFVPLDAMVAAVAPLHLPSPVLISPPMHAGGKWSAKSDTRNRPLRVEFTLAASADNRTATILSRSDFRSKPWLDRAIGFGIAAHEGRLFGLANQLVSLFTTIGLVMLSFSGLLMWRKRKPQGSLGAPAAAERVRWSAGLVALLVAFGLYFPLLGGSMILVLLLERSVLSQVPATRQWLGLAGGK